MIATIVKEGRLAKGYTQQELADLTNISLRSIQRIEGGEVEPRAYTLKILAAKLDIPLQQLLNAGAPPLQQDRTESMRKIILSIGLSLFIILLGLAYAAQSSFPETHFEAALGWASLLGLIMIILVMLWPGKIKAVCSIGFVFIAVLLAFAFVAQSPSFPETGFEALLYMAGVVGFITTVLLIVWRRKYSVEHPSH